MVADKDTFIGQQGRIQFTMKEIADLSFYQDP